MKKCSKCGSLKELEFFGRNKTKKDGLQSSCKDCQRKYVRYHYESNKEYYINKARKTRKKNQKTIQDLKEQFPCADCGNRYPYYVMDFDHLEDKEYSVATLMASGRITLALKEISKCELVCANCHRIRTHTRIAQMDRAAVYETEGL